MRCREPICASDELLPRQFELWRGAGSARIDDAVCFYPLPVDHDMIGANLLDL